MRSAERADTGASLLRALGVAVVGATAVYLAFQTIRLLGPEAPITGARRYAIAAAFFLSAVAAATMAVDLADRWFRGRRITLFSEKMMRSLIFVTLLTAFVLTLASKGPSLFLAMTPALVIYLLGTWRRPAARASAARRPAATSTGRSRQRRGGRRRRP